MAKNKLSLDQALNSQISALKSLKRSFPNIKKAGQILSSRKGKIVVTGVGKSAFIGMKIAATLTSLGHHSTFLHPVDALHGDSGSVADEDVLIAISFSGESPEVVKISKYLKNEFAVSIISITGDVKSSLSKLSDVVIKLDVRKEGSPLNLAPMASTTSSLVAGDLLATMLVEASKFEAKHFARFHPGGSLGLKLASVKSAMTGADKLPWVMEDDSLIKALKVITTKKKGIVGVLNKKNVLTGVITDGDVRRFISSNKTVVGYTARDAMALNPKVISSEISLKDALKEMERWKITSLFIIDERNKPVGLIHMHDIVNRTL